MPRIPKTLRQAIVKRLTTDLRPHNSREVTESVNPDVPQQHRRTARQMAFVLKQMVREGDLVIAHSEKNGTTAHGNERHRDTYTVPEADA